MGVHLGVWGRVVCIHMPLSVHGGYVHGCVDVFVYRHEEAAGA